MNWIKIGYFQEGFFTMGMIISIIVMIRNNFSDGLFMLSLSFGGFTIPYLFNYFKEDGKEKFK